MGRELFSEKRQGSEKRDAGLRVRGQSHTYLSFGCCLCCSRILSLLLLGGFLKNRGWQLPGFEPHEVTG